MDPLQTLDMNPYVSSDPGPDIQIPDTAVSRYAQHLVAWCSYINNFQVHTDQNYISNHILVNYTAQLDTNLYI